MLVDDLNVRFAAKRLGRKVFDALLVPSLLGKAVCLHELRDGIWVMEAVLA